MPWNKCTFGGCSQAPPDSATGGPIPAKQHSHHHTMTTKIEIAAIGFIGVMLGSLTSFATPIVMHFLQRRSQAKLDDTRKKLLQKMLDHPERTWRKLSTLSHVIGLDEETTKRLLLELGARASEDGQSLWGLISRNPFPEDA